MLKSFRNMCNMPAYQGQNIMEVDNSRYSVENLGILKDLPTKNCTKYYIQPKIGKLPLVGNLTLWRN